LVVFAGIPLLLWVQTDLPVRSLFKESLSVLTILAFCQMLGMFFWSGINPYAVKEMKLIQVIKFHKIIGYTSVVILLLHPVFLVLPRFFESGVSPVDAFVTIITTFNQGIILGIVAWCLILIIGITCLIRKILPIRYTIWRKLHGILANVEEPSPGHFYWPDLDVDLGIESIEHPERFPLVSKGNAISSNLETA